VRRPWVKAVVLSSVLCLLSGLAISQAPDRFESLLTSAQQAQARGDFQSAAESYRQASALHPEIAELKANLGLMYYQTGKDAEAIQAFNQAIHLKAGLFVPNLFLGLDYVRLKRFSEAIPYLKRAAASKPTDLQAQLGLGQAYAGAGKTRLATSSYARAIQIDPGNADGWYHLGVSYLEQVEADARILLAQHKNSGYVHALVANSFFEQGAFAEAADAYKKALASLSIPPNTHARYGFALLNTHDLAGAERELNAELVSNPGSLLAKLGLARLRVEQDMAQQGAKEIAQIWAADPTFLKTNLPLFCAGLSREKRSELYGALEQLQAAGDASAEVVDLFRRGDTGETAADSSLESAFSVASTVPRKKVSAGNAAELYAKGSYEECNNQLASRLQLLQPKDLGLLASCAYSTGHFQVVLAAAQKLSVNSATEAEGLYWETKSVQKLAAEALARASQADATSPKLHVLLGDLYRQRKLFADAEQEYRKALALAPADSGALFGLSLTLLADNKLDEAFRLAQSAVEKNPDDPELNAVMGEILCNRDDLAGAEPYLKKSLNTKPELASHVHALLARVYARTNRTQQAIAELKLALAGDKDGSLHYQIARLYLQVGDQDSAKQAFQASEQLRREGQTRAAVAIDPASNQNELQ
jgi:tetratricopeptide (TPR) repeat protein